MTIRNLIGLGLVAFATIIVGYLTVSFMPRSMAQFAGASPSYLIPCTATAAASSSVTYMSTGAATTTVACNIQTGTTQAFNNAYLLVAFTGSSTASKITIAFEHSDMNGIDWYADETIGEAQQNGISTTTRVVDVSQPNSYTLSYASTTVGGTGAATATNFKIFNFNAPINRVRAIITMPAGSQNGAIWAQIIGKRENN